MSLLDKINKLGHYAKKAARAILTPVNTTIALVAISSALSFNPVQAQNTFKSTAMEITETGYGTLLIQDENSQGIEGATITWTPVDIPGDSIPNPYKFITNDVGLSNYEVMVFHDAGVGIQDNYDIEVVQARPNPSSDFTFNFIANERPNNYLQINSISGALIGKYPVTDYNNHVAVYHADLSDKAEGIYTATTIIDGKPHTSKIIKINGSYSGNLGSSAKPKANATFKGVQANQAIYDISIEAEGYFTLTDQRTVNVDDNGWGGYTLISDAPPPIDNQDLSGIITDLNNNYAPIAGATVQAFIPSLNQTISTTSASDGSFTLEDVPLDTDIKFSAGEVAGKYSIANFPFTTISEVVNPNDSVWPYFNVVLPDTLPTSTTLAHAIDQNLHGTNQDTTWFYLGNSLNSTEKNAIRNRFVNFQAEEDNTRIYAEKFEQSNKGMNIEFGTNNTQAYAHEIITPLGNSLLPVFYSNSTMSTGDDLAFKHEVKNGTGYDIVGWYSIQRNDAPSYTLEDNIIAKVLSASYWNAVYQDEKTLMPMQYLSENITSKSSNQPVKDVKARIDELKKAAEQKIIDENIPDYFNSTSSYGDVEFNYISK